MEFRKKIDIPLSDLKINHHSRLVLFGSCFAENIGKRLLDSKFKVDVNPFGVLYNPSSIGKVIDLLLSEKQFTESDIFFDKGLYHSLFYHSSFSHTNSVDFLKAINQSREESSVNLSQADILLVTFGTSYVYKHIETDEIVANCHKLPSSQFSRYRLSVENIVTEWSNCIKKLRTNNPRMKFLFTVSPIRHWKDEAHGNQLSKAILLLAIEDLANKHNDVFYFPSYELLLDELRDYRFYAEDMIHPSDVAVQYIWEKFASTFFDLSTQTIIDQWGKLKRAIDHRPFNIDTEEHKHFLRQTLLKLKNFRNNYPYFDTQKERIDLENRLSSYTDKTGDYK